MLGVDHDKIILLSTPFPTIPMLGKNCCCGVIVFDVGNKRCCIVLYCIVLYCIVLYCIVLYCIVLYCIVLYCIVLYCIVLYCIVLYCIVLYCNQERKLNVIFASFRHFVSPLMHSGLRLTRSLDSEQVAPPPCVTIHSGLNGAHSQASFHTTVMRTGKQDLSDTNVSPKKV